MAEKAGESLRKCAVHNDQLMTHFDLVNKKPACEVTTDILLPTIWYALGRLFSRQSDETILNFNLIFQMDIFVQDRSSKTNVANCVLLLSSV